MAKTSNLPRVIAFLNSVNAKNDYTNTIWYAIVPAISLDAKPKAQLKRERFKGNDVIENEHVNSIESLARLMDVFKDYRIQCFFSFEGSEHTTFNHLAVNGVDGFIDRLTLVAAKQYSEFAIPCFPNFTIVPKDKSGVVLDKRIVMNEAGAAVLSKEKEDVMRLWVEGVYVGAAFVAAGLVAAYQCPMYLREKFKSKVHKSLPGVRFDIEQGNNALQVTTTMAKEIMGFTTSIKDQINRRNFGFVFSSENAALGSAAIGQAMVYKARCLMTEDGVYAPIYKTQTTTYIERILRHATSDFKADNIREFFSSRPTSQKSEWGDAKEYINGIIQVGDDINFSIDETAGICTLDTIFNGDSKNLEIDIRRRPATA